MDKYDAGQNSNVDYADLVDESVEKQNETDAICSSARGQIRKAVDSRGDRDPAGQPRGASNALNSPSQAV